MGAGVFTIQIMAVVGGYQWQLQFGCYLHQTLVDDILLRNGVFLQLNIIAVGEQFAVPAGGFESLFHSAATALHGHLSFKAG